MRLPSFIVHWLNRRVARVMDSRPPDQVIGGADDPYLMRWYAIPRNPVFNVYLHMFMRSDDDRALHDHPWWNLSVLLEGSYIEHTIAPGGVNVMTRRTAGAVKFRGARSAHRIELYTVGGDADPETGSRRNVELPCRTLFVTGPKLRSWGFHCPRGWRHWKEFTAPHDSGQIGRGCD